MEHTRLPIDGLDKSRRETIFAVPILFSAGPESVSINLFLVHRGELFVVDPESPFLHAERNTVHP